MNRELTEKFKAMPWRSVVEHCNRVLAAAMGDEAHPEPEWIGRSRLTLNVADDVYDRIEAAAQLLGLKPSQVVEHAVRELFGLVPA